MRAWAREHATLAARLTISAWNGNPGRMDSPQVTFARRWQVWRHWSGMSKTEVARELNVHASMPQKWEAGTDTTVARLYAYCHLLGITLERFFGPLPKRSRSGLAIPGVEVEVTESAGPTAP